MSLVCSSSANCLRAFLCIIFRRGFLLGRQSCRTIWCSVRRMVWALTGWPLPFNLCSNASSTHTSISQTQPLDMTLSTCTWPWRDLSWVEPALLNRCMVLVLTFVASGLDINGCVLSYFEGTANLHCYTSCTLTTLHCSKVSFLQCRHMKKYNKTFTKMWGMYSLLWVIVNLTNLTFVNDIIWGKML